MSIKIGFRVTGMFFGSAKPIVVEIDNPKSSVRDVMLKVSKLVEEGGVPGVESFIFSPRNPSDAETLSSITIKYSEGPNGVYSPGTYHLEENLMGNPILAFQFYHFRANMQQVNNNNRTNTFGEPIEDIFKDGDIIIWRQIAILQAPNGLRQVESLAVKEIDSLKRANLI
ncbi:hypothetical protein Plim_3205 [Planctopirus limnophila DSM 3776]|uniref:Uncharacterized protein n=1 Tax=Planctopirus limnophila (strain ATCC 43296 / DSM 3776 / IFAM 1008 / Mu 290) TaxID=521674 RepID=D5STJ0_PLAL2|nr:hypothetical protein [Planctopirus limnophila]ADG69019.1 hypothetical protein Plim_3205 [Planctopirus limnophila DSM 3776]